jgi:transposase-like protein
MQLNMGIIKFEVSVPEATRAIEEFRRNRIRALEVIGREVKSAVSSMFNQLLQTEMAVFLGRPDQSENKRNGFHEREYALKGVGCIRIRMPVDREREFQSTVIPKHEQIDPRLKQDIAVMHLAGLSTRTLAMVSKRILGVDVSPATVSASLGTVEDKALSFLTRDLSGKKYWALFVDGTNFPIQRLGTTEKEPSLVVLGLDERYLDLTRPASDLPESAPPAPRSKFSQILPVSLVSPSATPEVGFEDLDKPESIYVDYFPD